MSLSEAFPVHLTLREKDRFWGEIKVRRRNYQRRWWNRLQDEFYSTKRDLWMQGISI